MSLTTTTTSTLQSTQHTLTQATQDLQIRSEVSTVLQSLLTDIELSHQLQTDLQHANAIQTLQRKIKIQQNELDERRAFEESESRQRIQLADKFVGELFVLSVKLNELERWKDDNYGKIQSYDELKRNLDRAEETVRGMKRTVSLNSNALRDPSSDGGGDVVGNCEEEKSGQEYAMANKGSENIVELESEVIKDVEKETRMTTTTTSTVEKEETKEEASFGGMNEELLLTIFSYLDPLDVLRAAQVNVSFYSKVDSLFGFGNESSPADPEQERGPEKVPEEKEAEPKKAEEQQPPATAASVTPPRPSTPVPTPALAPALKEQTTPPRAGAKALAKMFSLLQHKPQSQPLAKGTSTATSTTTAPSKDPSTIPSKDSTTTTPAIGELSASLANSMADKLTPAELSVIINMTEKLRHKDLEITRITAEREDLSARLEGTEAVKEFLIGKVRDTERSLKQSKDDAVKLTQQTVSDQEVIAFLDSRVQELERTGKELKEGKVKAEEALGVLRKQSGEKQKVIEDMLQFERQQLKDQEREWKAQKKLLVKEIKHCRAQIVALQAERDSFRQQNSQLKEALLTLNGGGSAGGSKR